ncbi:MAG: hypothetical protein PVJ33_11815 [Lysobacterales bacterium]
MDLLFIGGTGIISSGCVQLALERGHAVTLLNRGRSAPAPVGCRQLIADIRDIGAARSVLGDADFDVVVDFVAFEPAHLELDLELFRDRCGQFVFISSASAYQTPRHGCRSQRKRPWTTRIGTTRGRRSPAKNACARRWRVAFPPRS